jgi:ribokinase
MTLDRGPNIVVVGSINMDLVIRCVRLPVPGQTIIANSLTEICGGKGANQAVAAKRAGGNTTMIGCVGDDGFADQLMGNFHAEAIDCRLVRRCPGPSGTAVVAVEDSGQNCIMVVRGSNGNLSPEHVCDVRDTITGSDVVMLQLEVPMETVLAVIDLARTSDVKIMLDPAPAPALVPEQLLAVDLLCPNETEAAALTGLRVESVEDATRAARKLVERGAKAVVVTLGDDGAVYFDGERNQHVPPFETKATDTTAAGDAFAGALAVKWATSGNLIESLQFANAAGSLAASREGAQPSLPTRDEIEKKLHGVPE